MDDEFQLNTKLFFKNLRFRIHETDEFPDRLSSI